MLRAKPTHLPHLLITSALLMAAMPLSAKQSPQSFVEQVCTTCHGLSTLERSSGYSEVHWQTLMGYMVDTGEQDEFKSQLSAYLAKTYPENTARASQVIAGDFTLDITYWQVPTLGQRARDPVQGSDGVIWWVGQWGNILGRLDPKTGEMKGIHLT